MIGRNHTIRSGTIIYDNVLIGDNFQTGHNVLIRDGTIIGNNVLVGTGTIIDGDVIIGNDVRIQSMCYIPPKTRIEDGVFLGPNVVLTNDKYPMSPKDNLIGPTIKRGAVICANCTILPGVEIGEEALVAAGAIVTKDIPPRKMAIGCPAKVVDIPDNYKNSPKI